MSAAQVIFILMAAVTLFSAVMVVSVRRMMHAALWLIVTLLGVAVLFVLLQAGFFAVVQVLIYIGAIAILIIFAVMLTRQVMSEKAPQLNRGWVAGLAAAGGLMVILTLVFRDFPARGRPWVIRPPGMLPAWARRSRTPMALPSPSKWHRYYLSRH